MAIKFMRSVLLICFFLLSILAFLKFKSQRYHHKEYHDNGKISVITTFDDSRKSQCQEHFNSSGILIEEYCFINNKVEGERKKYFESGSLAEEYTYSNDSKNGEFVFYYDNGNIKTKGRFRDDLQQGAQLNYNSNGIFRSYSYYHDDHIYKILEPKADSLVSNYRDTVEYIPYLSFISENIESGDTINIDVSFPIMLTDLAEIDSVFFEYDLTSDSTKLFYPTNRKLIKSDPLNLLFIAGNPGINYLFGFITVQYPDRTVNYKRVFQKIEIK